MYQRKGSQAYKPGLENMWALSKYLGCPEQQFSKIHIAGTNGKGSTAHLMTAVLQESGYKVGLYTSPHLVDFRERIKVDGQLISQQFVTQWVEENRSFLECEGFSFFEMTVGLAFAYFASQKVDIAVIEVGLGGRLDATNIIRPVLSVITNIGMDHTHILGDTLSKIAIEKAGIIKEEVPVVVGQTQPEIQPIFKNIAFQKNASVVFADQFPKANWKSDLKGPYQHYNLQTAAVALSQIPGFSIDPEHMRKGFAKVVPHTNLQGRWQRLQKSPLTIADVSHNKEGLALVVEGIQEQNYQKLHLVLGFVQEKNIAELIDLFPQDAVFYFCQPQLKRAFPVEELKKHIDPKLNARYFSRVSSAYEAAQEVAQPNDLIYVGGSTFVVAEILG